MARSRLDSSYLSVLASGPEATPSATPTRILPTHTAELFARAVDEAVARLRAGEVVALPTETVYGLAANAFEESAVRKVFSIKKRPARNPVIVHVASFEMIQRCVTAWPLVAQKLAAAFWPGPLTLVLPRSQEIPDIVTGGGDTVGIRWPSHPLIQKVIIGCGFPLAAPSANLSNALSPTRAGHVDESLLIPLVIDGGQCQVGIESTVVDLTSNPPRLLRPGMIDESALLAVTGELAIGFGDREEVLKSPGQLKKHYSPKTRLALLRWNDEKELRSAVAPYGVSINRIHVVAHSRIPGPEGWGRVAVIPHDPEAFARAIYGELHQGDAAGAELIVVEALPEGSAWSGIGDRLQRAAAEEA